MDYKNVNDFEVLYLIEEDQPEYKNMLFDKYQPVLKRLAFSYYERIRTCGVEYEDLYQEAMIALNYAIDHFKEENNTLFYSYALLCINSKLNSFCKYMEGVKNRVLNESVDLGEDVSIESFGNVHFEEDYPFFYDRIIRFKNSLNIIQAQVFELKYNGFSNSDIGILLGMTVKNVYYHLCSVRNRLVISGF